MLPGVCDSCFRFGVLCFQEPVIVKYLSFCRQLILLFIYWLIVPWNAVNEDLYRFYWFYLLFYDCSISFRRRLPSGCHKVTPAPENTNSLLAFIPDLLAHTASSICQCQVTMLINRSVLAAVKMRSCVVDARGSSHHLSSLWRAFPPTEHHAPDMFAPATYEDENSSLSPSAFVIDISTVFTFSIITVRRCHIHRY